MYSIGQRLKTKFNGKFYNGTIAHLVEDGEYIIFYSEDGTIMKTELPAQHTKLLSTPYSELVGDVLYFGDEKKYGNVFDEIDGDYSVFYPLSDEVQQHMVKNIIMGFKKETNDLIKNLVSLGVND